MLWTHHSGVVLHVNLLLCTSFGGFCSGGFFGGFVCLFVFVAAHYLVEVVLVLCSYSALVRDRE